MDDDIAWVSPRGFSGTVGMLPFPGLVILRRGERSIDSDRQERVLDRLAAKGVTLLVSLLDSDECEPEDVAHLRGAASDRGIAVALAPIADFCAPATSSYWQDLAGTVLPELDLGASVAFCCLAGAGRSGMMAARVLIAAGSEAPAAIAAVRTARPDAIESDDQVAYLLSCAP
ncbi:hypothetical protein [Bosea sp. WAO]|uniref:phosphatase domain-containing putative toxin n=1 Tax=Bosea sp. WAO TaxID=406341 RepID=UPI000835D6B5|nr:hypothetical protein [Bosea sp. WAO]